MNAWTHTLQGPSGVECAALPHDATAGRHAVRLILLTLWALLLALLASAPRAQTAGESPNLNPAQMLALEKAVQSVVGVRAVAVEGARSARTLGAVREGSGIVIGNDGLVLTIGYLILEADSVALVDDNGKRIPAQVVAYDLATGFGLVKSLVPLAIKPAELAAAPAAVGDEPLAIASGGEDGAISLARLMARKAFAGFWEYHIEGALFTSPPRRDHSGAGLFNTRGELVGVGSLVVADVGAAATSRVPGNMFVPVDLLQPILAELRQRGSSAASRRAWLGINCAEREGALQIVRVTDDSPAELAGLVPGDRILSIDGQAVAELGGLWKALWSGGQPERAVTLQIRRQGQEQTVVVNTVDRAKTLRRPEGI